MTRSATLPRRTRSAALASALVAAVGAGAAALAGLGQSAAAGSVMPLEPQVVLPQRVEPQVTLRPVRDESQRFSAVGTDLFAVSATGSSDVPDAALRAYRAAAATMARTDPACQLPWTLLAAIGRVESDHGRYGGAVLGADGVPRPAIIGIALDGHGPVAAIPDSDDGRYDGDPVWDRAVGPMQFIPTTWASLGQDGDGDGVADPQDIDDAALATAHHLCPSSGSVLPDAAMRAAVFSYNASDYYVDLVVAFEQGYRTGVFDIPAPPTVEPAPADHPGHRHHDGTAGPATPADSGSGSGGGTHGGSGDHASGTGGHGGTTGSGSGGHHGGGGTNPPPSAPPAPTPSATPTPAAPTPTADPTPTTPSPTAEVEPTDPPIPS